MAVPSLSLIDLVRDKTTDDTKWLPDSKIQAWLDYFQNDWRLAAAECLVYMARDDVYETYQRGGISVTKPLLRERAAELRSQALSAGGAEVTASDLVRGDYATATEDIVEYAIEHPAYEYGLGVIHTVKERAADDPTVPQNP